MIARKYYRSGYGFILGCALTTVAIILPSHSNAQSFARQPSIEIHLEALQALRNKQRAVYEAPASNPNAPIASEPLTAPVPLAATPEPIAAPAPETTSIPTPATQAEIEALDRELQTWHAPEENTKTPVSEPQPVAAPTPVPLPEPMPSAVAPVEQPVADSAKSSLEAPKEESVVPSKPAFLAHEDSKPKKAKKEKKPAVEEKAPEQPAFLEHETAPVPTEESVAPAPAAPAIEETVQPLDISDYDAQKPAEPSSLVDTTPEPATHTEEKSSFWNWVPFLGKKEAAEPSTAVVNPLTAPQAKAPEADNPMELPSLADMSSSEPVLTPAPAAPVVALTQPEPVIEPQPVEAPKAAPEPKAEPIPEPRKIEHKKPALPKPEPIAPVKKESAPATPLPHEENLTAVTLPEEKTEEAPIPVVPMVEAEAPVEVPEIPAVKAEAKKAPTPVESVKKEEPAPVVAPTPAEKREVITLPAIEAPVKEEKPAEVKAEKKAEKPVEEAKPTELLPPALPADTDAEISKDAQPATSEEEHKPAEAVTTPQDVAPVVEKIQKEEKPLEEPVVAAIPALPTPPAPTAEAPLELPNLPELPEVDAVKKVEAVEAKKEEAVLSNKELAALPLSEPKAVASKGALATLTFSPEEVDLPSTQASNLDSVISMLKDNPNKRIKIVSYGGNDRSGNLARRVALKRAIAVRKYFIEQGLAEIRINVQAMADAPATGENLDRVDIILMDGGNS